MHLTVLAGESSLLFTGFKLESDHQTSNQSLQLIALLPWPVSFRLLFVSGNSHSSLARLLGGLEIHVKHWVYGRYLINGKMDFYYT